MGVDTEPPAGCEVLLLEEDLVLRRRLAAHLRSLGAEVVEVSTIEEARQIGAEMILLSTGPDGTTFRVTLPLND